MIYAIPIYLFICDENLINHSIDSGGPASGWGNRGESSPYAYSGHGGRANAYEMNVRQHRV